MLLLRWNQTRHREPVYQNAATLTGTIIARAVVDIPVEAL